MTTEDFHFIRDLLVAEAGIELEPGKGYLVESRLLPVAQRAGLPSLEALIDHLRQEGKNGLNREVVHAMTINETSFFRDRHPFEALRHAVLPELIRRRAAVSQLNIWSAACSTGQEPYTVAMLLREYFPELNRWKVRLVASDLCHEVLAKAREGRYTQLEINRGLPPALLAKYFQPDQGEWLIKEEIRRRIEFQPFNLTKEWPPMPPWDLVLLRNVLIYFSQGARQRVLQRACQRLHPDGYLFLGTAENPLLLEPALERVTLGKCSCYRPRRNPAAPVPPPVSPSTSF